MKTILVDAVFTIVSETGVIFQEMVDLLDTYPSRKIILTGAEKDKWERYSLDKVPFEVFTLNHNPEKMEPRYYEKMLEHFKLSSNDAIYFEHSKVAVKSAKTVGIKTWHYDENKKDLKGLKDFLDKNV